MILLAQDLYSSEYIVSSYGINKLICILELGWGQIKLDQDEEN